MKYLIHSRDEKKTLFEACQATISSILGQMEPKLWKVRKEAYPKVLVWLAQLVECLTAEREVLGSISGAGPLLRVLK